MSSYALPPDAVGALPGLGGPPGAGMAPPGGGGMDMLAALLGGGGGGLPPGAGPGGPGGMPPGLDPAMLAGLGGGGPPGAGPDPMADGVAGMSSTDHIRSAIKHLMMAMTESSDEQETHGITKGLGALQGILAQKAKMNTSSAAAGGL